MSPNASERPFASRLPSRSSPGFTLLEVVVALAVGAILLWGLARFYKDSSRSYVDQSQIAERNQNAHYTVKTLTEAIQQSGASLPDSGYPVIRTSGGIPASSIVLAVNPRGGVHFVSSAAPANPARVPVGDTASFSKATHVLVDYLNPSRATARMPIAGMRKGASTGELDTILLTSGLPYQVGIGDAIYALKEERYALSGGNLLRDGMVLAENIDSLQFYFYDARKSATTSWAEMRSARIRVSARTARPDPRLPGDGYRKIHLSMDIFLRSRA